jgi:hypothetical protein
MVRMMSRDAFTYFYLLLFGLVFVAALCTRRKGRSPTCVDVRGVGRLPARLDRIENRVSVRLTGPISGRTRVPGLDTSGLDVYAREFEEAIERIRLRSMGFRGWEGSFTWLQGGRQITRMRHS